MRGLFKAEEGETRRTKKDRATKVVGKSRVEMGELPKGKAREREVHFSRNTRKEGGLKQTKRSGCKAQSLIELRCTKSRESSSNRHGGGTEIKRGLQGGSSGGSFHQEGRSAVYTKLSRRAARELQHVLELLSRISSASAGKLKMGKEPSRRDGHSSASSQCEKRGRGSIGVRNRR